MKNAMENLQKSMASISENAPASILRFLSAGSVDDGKSTLIGRLLSDTRSILADQFESISQASLRQGKSAPDLSFYTDGLRAERERGITIDVAYRYFSTPRRKFIVADTPGHLEFTRNMVTGASNSELMLILADARHGLVEQTRRHALIASLLGIKQVILCVNKMDLVGFSEAIFNRLAFDFSGFAKGLNIPEITCLPISALEGDNVVWPSGRMPWFSGKTLLQELETTEPNKQQHFSGVRFPVQMVLPGTPLRIAGRLEAGEIQVGQKLELIPLGQQVEILGIELMDKILPVARESQSVALLLENSVEIERGNWLVSNQDLPVAATQIRVMVCWLNARKLQAGETYLIKHTTRFLEAKVSEVLFRINVNSLQKAPAENQLQANEIGEVMLEFSEEFYFDLFSVNKATGSLIFINSETLETAGAGMIL
jgi:sulfate adenylyltransferase large subunit